jgi:predicted deacylase
MLTADSADNGIVRLDDFDLDNLEPGMLHLVRLRLAQDGLGRPIRIPLMVARGRKPGLTLALSAALHGNELNGIPVIHRLVSGLDLHALRGTVIGVVVANVPGLLLRQRRFADGVDLNHVFPGKADGTPAQVYVHAFVRALLPRIDRLIDLHTASFGRVNSLYIRADMTDPVAARMALLQRPEIIVHNPPSDMTFRGTAAAMGVPAVTVEIGNPHRYHRKYVRQTVAGLRAVLADQGMIRKRKPTVELPEAVVCSESAWLRTDAGGLLDVLPNVAEMVEEGDEIARLRDEFGRLRRVYYAPYRAVVVGRSVDPVAPTGTRYVHLGKVAPADSFPLNP